MKKISFILLFLFMVCTPFTSMALENEDKDYIDYDNTFYLNEEATGKGVKVAVLDSGISNHPDLTVSGGYNFINPGASYEDDNNHGTMVAGVLAGKKDAVAPDVELYSLKVLDSNGRGTSSEIIKALDWSIKHDIDIVNISIIMDSSNVSLDAKIKEAVNEGIIVVACAGNNGGIVTSPANVDGVISVGALNSDLLTKASFSAYIGKVDYWAKGASITSTNRFGYYESGWNGTSFASPYVAGMFALYKEAFPEATADELKEIVLSNSTINDNTGYRLVQKPKYEERGYIQLKTVNGKFQANHVVRYFPISKLAS